MIVYLSLRTSGKEENSRMVDPDPQWAATSGISIIFVIICNRKVVFAHAHLNTWFIRKTSCKMLIFCAS